MPTEYVKKIDGRPVKDEEAYNKPSSGIPKSDLASAVQTSLGKADSAVQPAALNSYQNKNIQDSTVKDYFSDNGSAITVESALKQLAQELAGANTLIGSGAV